METRKIRIIIGLWIASIILAIILFLLLRINSSNENLIASDAVAANAQFIPQVDNSPDTTDIGFFTGTSLASLNANPNNDNYLKTVSLGKDFPVSLVDRVRRKNEQILVRANYRKDDIPLNTALGASARGLSNGPAWFILSRNKFEKASFDNHALVADAAFSDNGYFVLERNGNTQRLVNYSTSGEKQVLSDNTSATSISATAGNGVALRDYGGKLFLWDGSSLEEIAPRVNEVYFDHKTTSLLYSTLEAEHVSDEGGVASHDHSGSAKASELNVINLLSKSKATISPAFGNLYVSNGFIVSTNAVARPTEVEFYDIENSTSKKLLLSQDFTKLVNQIKSVAVTSTSPFTVFAFTDNDQVVIWGNKDTFDAIPQRVYKPIPAQQDTFVYDYSLGRNSVAIYGYKNPRTFVNDSLDALKRGCDCDTNQLNKTWVFIEED